MPDALARRLADLPLSDGARPTSCWSPTAPASRSPTSPRPTFAAGAFFRSTASPAAARDIAVSDYFDRLALDRALDSIGDAERRLTAAMVRDGASGRAAVEAWVAPRGAEVERIRPAVHEIAGSGLTLSKLTVAASLLGDLARIS